MLHAFVTPDRTAGTFAVSTAASSEGFAVWVIDGGRQVHMTFPIGAPSTPVTGPSPIA